MNAPSPRVSVLVPCYNHETYIDQCLQSILDQTYENIELIVIDDGSSDGSAQRIEALAAQRGFYFERQKNQGLSATLNKMIALSHGKYIAICASDDAYLPHKIQAQVAYFQENPNVGLCFSDVLFLKEGQPTTRSANPNARSGYAFEELLQFDFSCPAVTVMVPRAVYDDVGGFDESLSVEDWDMWLRISSRYPIGYLNDALAYYRLHDSNAHRHSERMHAANLQTLQKWTSHPAYFRALKGVNAIYLRRLFSTGRTTRAMRLMCDPRFSLSRRGFVLDALRHLKNR